MLEWRHVLIFVDDEETILFVHLQRYAGLGLQETSGEQQYVFEINRRPLVLDALIGALNIHALFHGERARHRPGGRTERIGVKRQVGDLAPLDFCGNVPQ